MPHTSDVVTTVPTIEGSHGRAWKLDAAALHARGAAQVALWIIEAPWAHPVWHSYMLSVIHLRDLPGLARPILYVPGATHELLLCALDPDEPRQVAIDQRQTGKFLTPANFAAQLIKSSDAAAGDDAEWAARMICNGRLSPDTDFRAQWIDKFGGAMIPAWTKKRPPGEPEGTKAKPSRDTAKSTSGQT